MVTKLRHHLSYMQQLPRLVSEVPGHLQMIRGDPNMVWNAAAFGAHKSELTIDGGMGSILEMQVMARQELK